MKTDHRCLNIHQRHRDAFPEMKLHNAQVIKEMSHAGSSFKLPVASTYCDCDRAERIQVDPGLILQGDPSVNPRASSKIQKANQKLKSRSFCQRQVRAALRCDS